MCGRYRLSRRKELIEEYFEAANEVDWEPRFSLVPSTQFQFDTELPSLGHHPQKFRNLPVELTRHADYRKAYCRSTHRLRLA